MCIFDSPVRKSQTILSLSRDISSTSRRKDRRLGAKIISSWLLSRQLLSKLCYVHFPCIHTSTDVCIAMYCTCTMHLLHSRGLRLPNSQLPWRSCGPNNAKNSYPHKPSLYRFEMLIDPEPSDTPIVTLIIIIAVLFVNHIYASPFYPQYIPYLTLNWRNSPRNEKKKKKNIAKTLMHGISCTFLHSSNTC